MKRGERAGGGRRGGRGRRGGGGAGWVTKVEVERGKRRRGWAEKTDKDWEESGRESRQKGEKQRRTTTGRPAKVLVSRGGPLRPGGGRVRRVPAGPAVPTDPPGAPGVRQRRVKGRGRDGPSLTAALHAHAAAAPARGGGAGGGGRQSPTSRRTTALTRTAPAASVVAASRRRPNDLGGKRGGPRGPRLRQRKENLVKGARRPPLLPTTLTGTGPRARQSAPRPRNSLVCIPP